MITFGIVQTPKLLNSQTPNYHLLAFLLFFTCEKRKRHFLALVLRIFHTFAKTNDYESH